MSRERFKGKTAIVTGAASGVGLKVVHSIAEEGGNVIAADLSPDVHNLTGLYDGRIKTIVADVSDSAAVEDIFSLTEQEFGRADILISNAGHIVPKTILDTSEDEWDRVMNVNAKALFLLAKRAIPNMLDAGMGAVVVTASISSVVGLPSQAAYCASKGAMLQLVKQLAVEYAANNIRFNAVGPGAIATPFLTRYFDAQPDPAEAEKAVRASHPMNRWAEPEEVAKAVTFLASEDSSFTTGEILMVDGGYVAQ